MPDQAAGADVLDKASFEFTTTGGPGVEWRVQQMRLLEGINEEFELEVDLVTRDIDADLAPLLGASAEFTMGRGGHARMVYGIVSDFVHIGQWGLDVVIRARVVPAFTLLRQRVHSRIFQEKSVQDILSEVLTDALDGYGRTFSVGEISRGTAVRDYCVQYGESDRDFVVRLLEEEGISFHFVHDDALGHEVLTLTDDNAQFAELENVDGTSVFPIVVKRPELIPVESLRNLDWARSLAPTSALRRDYDWHDPTGLLTESTGGADDSGRERRRYGHLRRRYVDNDLATRVKDDLEAARLRHKTGRGESNATALVPGGVLEVDRHPHVAELEEPQIVLWVAHEGRCPEELVHGFDAAPDDGPRYGNRFETIPASVPVRPRESTPKPVIAGPQTAIVTGQSGEEIETDAYGRIKVQFGWEEAGAYDETSSCWVRVAQALAGPGWGAQFIPRIGMEVVVTFLDGNPDAPLVTGCVYNGDNAFPFALPDNKTQSGLRTDSSIGEGFNELRFEDAADREEIYIRAQKDKRVYVKHDHERTVDNDETVHVLNDRTKTVDHDQSESVGNHKNISVGGNHTEEVAGNYVEAIGGEHEVKVDKSRKDEIAKHFTQGVGENMSVDVGKKASEHVGDNKDVSVDKDYTETVEGKRIFEVTGELSTHSVDKTQLTADDDFSIGSKKKLSVMSDKAMSLQTADKFSITGDKKGTLEFADELTIKVGKATLVLKKSGDIEINGKKLDIKMSGDVAIKGSKIKQN